MGWRNKRLRRRKYKREWSLDLGVQQGWDPPCLVKEEITLVTSRPPLWNPNSKCPGDFPSRLSGWVWTFQSTDGWGEGRVSLRPRRRERLLAAAARAALQAEPQGECSRMHGRLQHWKVRTGRSALQERSEEATEQSRGTGLGSSLQRAEQTGRRPRGKQK